MSALKSIALVVGLSILYIGLVIVGFYAFGGAGHGSGFFAAAVLSPFSMSEGVTGLWLFGLVIWPTVGTLLAFRRFHFCTIGAAVVLVLHYLGIVVLSFRTDWHHVGKVWDAFPILVAAFVATYLGSQAFIWMLIARKPHAPPQRNASS